MAGALLLAACAPAVPATPAAAGTIVVRGLSYELPGSPPGTPGSAGAPSAFRAGPASYRVLNRGDRAHEVRVMRMRSGGGAEDAVQFLLGAGSRTPPGEFVGGRLEVPGGGEGVLELDLGPGDYALVCTLRDPASGQPYAARGLARDLTVVR